MVTLYVQNFHRWLTHLQLLAVIFHNIVNGFFRQGSSNQLMCNC